MGRFWVILFTLLGLAALSALVWFVGPFLGFGASYPMEDWVTRLIVIATVWAIAGLVWLIRWLLRRRAARKLETGIAQGPGDDTPILKDKLADALSTLKRSSKRGGSAFLYDLPWYILIGPPGSGKTTALINSGLKFPLAGPGGAQAIAGVGGTRHCDWWFTDEAVMIDTAGRYTTQDSDSEADRRSWFGFLDMLQTTRPRQPINGALICISVEDIMTLPPHELEAHSAAIRRRLDELHQRLKISFPVYVMLTKLDLVAGFTEFFGDLSPEQRQMVWGATFQPKGKTDNMVASFPAEFDALMDQLAAQVTDRLQQEPDARARARVFGFPTQMASLREPLNALLTRVFEPSRYQSEAVLRGVYLTSGTQEGTPIDRVIGALARSFGTTGAATPTFSGRGRSYFLTDLMQKVVFLEQSWVGTNLGHVRRRIVVKTAMYIGLVAGSAAMAALWVNSYTQNAALIAATDRDVDEYRELAAPLLNQAQVGDGDLAQALPLLQKLRFLRVGYGTVDEGVPLAEGLGLSQHARLKDATVEAYRDALDRLFLPRLVWRQERLLEQNLDNPAFVYEALKVYLMLGGQAKLDPDLVRAWFMRDWEVNLYPGAGNAGGREALAQHLEALIERPSSAVALNGPLVSAAQRSLARLPLADRAYSLMKTRAQGVGYEPWVAAQRGGPDAAVVFETTDGGGLDTVTVPGLYTYAGFHDGILAQMEPMVERARSEQWVMGDAGAQATIEAQFGSIRQDILARYGREFIAAWDGQLARLKIASVGGGGDLTVMSALAAPTSPLKQLLASLGKETKLTFLPPAAEGEGGDSAAGNAAGRAAQQRLGAVAGQLGGAVGKAAVKDAVAGLDGAGAPSGQPLLNPGESIEAHFKPIHEFVGEPSAAAPVDALIARFNDLYKSMNAAASGQGGAVAAQATQQMQADLAALQADMARMPGPVAAIAKGAAAELQGMVLGTGKAQLNQALGDEIVKTCQTIIDNRYPFYRDSTRDVPLTDFARLLGPNGLMDTFFQQKLIGMVDQSGAVWKWRQDTDLARQLSNDALRQFQYAAEIRDAFFAAGGGLPQVAFTVLPITLSPDAYDVTFDVEGSKLVYDHRAARPLAMTWPGPNPGRTAIATTPEIPGQQSSIATTGTWSLMRMVDQGAALLQGDQISVSFTIGGREASFQMAAGSVLNPFTLPALGAFRCPRGF